MAEKPDAACRADIPPLLAPEQRDALTYTPQCRQRWGERQVEGATPPLKAEDIDEFLKDFAWLKETELALQCLFDGEFDVPKAVGLLHAARRERYKARRDQDERLPSEDFQSAVATHGKKFHLVKQALGEKVITREVVRKYYLWKRTTEFKEWRRRQEAKKVKKKKREAELLRQWGDDSDADPETEAFLGYHNAHCELCATGGKLLCCDGCARAYHFSCVQPPITKVPSKDEDWFCSYCQAAFGGPKPKLLPSEDNEYCLVCPPLPDVPRSLIEAVTDASSYEEEDEAEDNSDEEEDDEGSAGSEPNDDVASTNDGDTSDFPSTEDLSPDTGNSGNITDDESENTSSKVPSPSDGGVDNSRSNNDTTPIERKPGELVAPRHQAGAEIQKTGLSVGSSQPAVYTAVPHRSTEPSPVGARRVPPTQLERPGSGRKRHRKTLVPRRIPPSHFDS